jgi:hypothetical protein
LISIAGDDNGRLSIENFADTFRLMQVEDVSIPAVNEMMDEHAGDVVKLHARETL